MWGIKKWGFGIYIGKQLRLDGAACRCGYGIQPDGAVFFAAQAALGYGTALRALFRHN